MLKAILLGSAVMIAGATQAEAQTQTRDDIYTLGELQVTAQDRQGERVGGAVVTAQQLRNFDKVSLDQALDLVAGGLGR